MPQCPIAGDANYGRRSSRPDAMPMSLRVSAVVKNGIEDAGSYRVILKELRLLMSVELGLYKNSSGDEIANVNFSTTTSSTTFTQGAPEATEFGELMQHKGHYVVQDHSRSPILVPIESPYMISYISD